MYYPTAKNLFSFRRQFKIYTNWLAWFACRRAKALLCHRIPRYHPGRGSIWCAVDLDPLHAAAAAWYRTQNRLFLAGQRTCLAQCPTFVSSPSLPVNTDRARCHAHSVPQTKRRNRSPPCPPSVFLPNTPNAPHLTPMATEQDREDVRTEGVARVSDTRDWGEESDSTKARQRRQDINIRCT
jgi:hypothetical protein